MKPSERIKEIHIEIESNVDPILKLMGFNDTFEKAVLMYLDEEYAKKKEAEAS